MITECKWHLFYMPLTRYLTNIRRSFAQRPAGKTRYRSAISDKTFSLEKTEEAIIHGKELIDFEVSPLLPF